MAIVSVESSDRQNKLCLLPVTLDLALILTDGKASWRAGFSPGRVPLFLPPVGPNMSPGKALDARERQLVVQLKHHFDPERQAGPLVTTKDPAGRVAAALGIGLRTVKEILSTYHRTGTVSEPALEHKGKPPDRIQPAFETVIRQRIRERNRQGCQVSMRTLAIWFSQPDEEITGAPLWRTLQRLGFVDGPSRHRSGLKERDDVLVARRAYLRSKLANRKPPGGTRRSAV
jgi:transposase